MAATPYVTGAQIQPIIDGLTATVNDFLPVLLSGMGLFLAIKFIPRLVRYFTKG